MLQYLYKIIIEILCKIFCTNRYIIEFGMREFMELFFFGFMAKWGSKDINLQWYLNIGFTSFQNLG